MPFEDCALYLAVPDAIVLDPSDYVMFINLLKKLYAWYGVSYLRMVRKNSARIYEDGADFEIGKGVLLREGNDVTIVAHRDSWWTRPLKRRRCCQNGGYRRV